MAIDVQNGMVLAQIFNYLPDGTPTFHMGSASYQAMGNEAVLDINRYQGGRFIGGPAASGSLAEAAGQVALRFSADGTAQSQRRRTKGGVQLPGEAPQQMVRMALESMSPQSLMGQWWLTFRNDSGEAFRGGAKFVNLTQLDNNAFSSDDGAVRCEPPPQGLQNMKCVWSKGSELWSAYVFHEPNTRNPDALQVRDRHGNLTGLGNVPLD